MAITRRWIFNSWGCRLGGEEASIVLMDNCGWLEFTWDSTKQNEKSEKSNVIDEMS
jgi:hypothetical protein